MVENHVSNLNFGNALCIIKAVKSCNIEGRLYGTVSEKIVPCFYNVIKDYESRL